MNFVEKLKAAKGNGLKSAYTPAGATTKEVDDLQDVFNYIDAHRGEYEPIIAKIRRQMQRRQEANGNDGENHSNR